MTSMNQVQAQISKLGYSLITTDGKVKFSPTGCYSADTQIDVYGPGHKYQLKESGDTFNAHYQMYHVQIVPNHVKLFFNLTDIETWVCQEQVSRKEHTEVLARASEETISAYVKVMIHLNNIKTNEDLAKVRAALLPGALFEPFEGLNWLITRYPSRELAEARALDAECAAYCGRAEIEESYTYQEQTRGRAGFAQIKRKGESA